MTTIVMKSVLVSAILFLNLRVYSQEAITPAERFIKALKGGTPERVPIYEPLFSRTHQKELLGYSTELYEGATERISSVRHCIF